MFLLLRADLELYTGGFCVEVRSMVTTVDRLYRIPVAEARHERVIALGEEMPNVSEGGNLENLCMGS